MSSMRNEIIEVLTDMIKSDSEMQSILGDIRVRVMYAQPDERFPYIVHGLSIDTEDPWPIVQGDYTIDVWDDNYKAERIWAATQRLQEIFGRRFPVPIRGTFAAMRMWLDSEDEMPTDQQNIWHMTQVYGFRLYRVKAAQAILNR